MTLGLYNSSSDNAPVVSADADTHFMHMFFKSTASSGDNRGMYLRTHYTGGGGGDALRALGIAMAATGTMTGGHVTGQIGTGGSITGLLAGLRATAATSSGLTLSGGTLAALQVDSDLGSAVTGMTEAAFIRVADINGTNKMPLLIATDGVGSGSGATTLIKTGSAFATCTGGLRCQIGGSVVWIPFGTIS
jgi:microcompartment protein CcmK/EutM